MTHKQFVALARGVYGRTWQVEIAKRNQVHRSTAHRWGRGEITIPLKAIERLREAAENRLSEIQQAIAA